MKYQVKTVGLTKVIKTGKTSTTVADNSIIGEYDDKETAIKVSDEYLKEHDTHCEVRRISTVYQTNAASSEGTVIMFG